MQQVLIIICLSTTWIPQIRDTSSRRRKKTDKSNALFSGVHCYQNPYRQCRLIFAQTSIANH